MSGRAVLLALALLAVVAGSAHAQPAVIEPPAIGGEPVVGRVLVAGPALLDGAEPADTGLQWERSQPDGAYAPIGDATDPEYRLGPDDAGRLVRVRITVETPAGADTAVSAAVGPVRREAGTQGRLAVGPLPTPADPDAPWAALSRWTVEAGGELQVRGRLGAVPADAALELRLEPTVPTGPEVAVALSVGAGGVIRGAVAPAVNAVVWLVIDGDQAAAVRVGVVGVRPRIDARIAARPDGRDAAGRPLVRDLRLVPGSAILPRVVGLRLSWEGILPGEQAGTAVCRATERVVSGADGALAGGCRTRGAWAAARWRLVYDPGTDDPGAAPFLPAASAWSRPVLRLGRPAAVPVLPRACATLPAWTSASSRSSSRARCPAAAPPSRTSWAPAATTSPSASSPRSSRARA
jgi:hypothetical protein